MTAARVRSIVKFIRGQKTTRDLKHVLVDQYEIGYDEAALLIMLSKTNFA